jgi:hypothetical protein
LTAGAEFNAKYHGNTILYVATINIDRISCDGLTFQCSVNSSWYALQEKEKAGTLTPGQRRILEIPRAEIELYDLEADPYELVNIADNPENQAIVRGLMRRMQRLRRETNDHYLEK